MHEFEMIQKYFAPLTVAEKGALALSDDAAVISARAGMQAVYTKDIMIAGVHFFPNDDPYLLAQKLFGMPKSGEITYTKAVYLDLKTVVPCVAGPKRPQDRITLTDLRSTFINYLRLHLHRVVMPNPLMRWKILSMYMLMEHFL